MEEGRMVSTARLISRLAHKGQTDKAGVPYYKHPETVASYVHTDTEKTVALLHDVLEDTDVTEEELRSVFPDAIVDDILYLTHPEGMDYMEYIERLAGNDVARHVKMADLRHNMDLSRFHGNVPEKIRRKRETCYLPAMAHLEAMEKGEGKMSQSKYEYIFDKNGNAPDTLFRMILLEGVLERYDNGKWVPVPSKCIWPLVVSTDIRMPDEEEVELWLQRHGSRK